jgi:hypothetical protein
MGFGTKSRKSFERLTQDRQQNLDKSKSNKSKSDKSKSRQIIIPTRTFGFVVDLVLVVQVDFRHNNDIYGSESYEKYEND